MAKESKRQCRDCRGSLECYYCHGKGIRYSARDSLASALLGGKDYHPCEICSHTGQCQTCGGTGYEYFYEKSSTHTNRRNRNIEYSSEGGSSSGGGGSSDGDSMVFPIIGLFVFACIVLALLNDFGIVNTNGSKKYETNREYNTTGYVDDRLYNTEFSNQPQIAECESKNTGEYSFINKTSRTIYVFISTATWWETIEVKPHQTYRYDLTAHSFTYSYTYDYYKAGNFDNNKVHGEILVEKCQSKILELTLPASYWYKLSPDVWKEIYIPEGCCYAFVAPYKNFLFRYSENDVEHYCNSYLFLSEGISKIYVKSQYVDEIEVSIQKYIPR